jgi:hypothetical protein
MKIKTLSQSFHTNGRTMTQIWREGSFAIYQDSNFPADHYEAIVIRLSKPHPRDPNPECFSHAESYPSSEKWGTYGWTYTSNSHHHPLSAAQDRIKRLQERSRVINSSAFVDEIG